MYIESEELKETAAVIKSGTSAVHLCGDDYSRIDEFVTQLAVAMGFTKEKEESIPGVLPPETRKITKANVVEWNYGYGEVDFENKTKIENPNREKIPFSQFLEKFKNFKKAEKTVILIRNARHILEGEANRENLAQLQQTIVHLKKFLSAQAVLIYCDEKRFIPDELSSLVHFLDVKPPSQDELKIITSDFIKKKKLKLDSQIIEQLSAKCVGMNEDSFKQILEKAALEKNKNFAEIVLPIADKTKKQFVDKSGLLKYVSTDVKIDGVGGLEQLKWWLQQKEKAFKDLKWAKERGITPAKGILLVGMPGCGKSLASKAVANFFNLPLLSLDLGSLMGKYLGDSEGNLRRALNLAEYSSPCVLWVDEIEKAFAGISGDESGVSQRLFGYLLTWLNDKTAQVFVMATANDVAVLPPEFLRRGRFDEIFYVDFPNAQEREEIFKIHIGKAFGGKEKFEEILKKKGNEKFDELICDTEGYAGSDIEALVNSAIERAGKQEKNLETEIFSILHSERKYMKPQKEVLAEKIARNKEKFSEYKLTSASETNLQSLEIDSESNNEEDLKRVARHVKSTDDMLRNVAKKGFKEVNLLVLDNKNCPPDLIYDLMENSDPEVKAKAKEKQLATPEGIIKIAREGTKEPFETGDELERTPENFIQNIELSSILSIESGSLVSSVAFSPNGKYIVSGTNQDILNLWDAKNGQLIQEFEGHRDSVISVAFSPDGKHIVSGSSDMTLILWEAKSGQLIQEFEGHHDRVNSVAFSPDGKYIVSGSDDNTLMLWDAKSGQIIRSFTEHKDGVISVAFSPNGKHIVSGSDDMTLKLWDAENGKLIRSLIGHKDEVWSSVFSPNGKYIVSGSGSDDMTLKLWDAENGKLIRSLIGHKDGVWSAVFSPNGKYIVSGSVDETLILWETESGKPLVLCNIENEVNSVAFSPNGKYIVSGSDDGIELWELKGR